MKIYSGDGHINVGSGEDLTILALTEMVCEVVGFNGTISHDLSKPDGTPRKLMSADKLLALGWRPSISLPDGLADAYGAYRRLIAIPPEAAG
jgi:GDP-L-fucose synthase